MTFESLTAIVPTIINTALPGFVIESDEGLELEQFKAKYSTKVNNQIYINLRNATTEERYTNGEALLLFNYDVYVHSNQDTAEIILKIAEKIQEYSQKCFVTLNGTSYKAYVSDTGAVIINDTEKWINYGVEIYV